MNELENEWRIYIPNFLNVLLSAKLPTCLCFNKSIFDGIIIGLFFIYWSAF